MFNAVREPHLLCDQMKISAESRHVAVLHRGHLFKIPLQDDQGDVPLESFEVMFQTIVDADSGEDSWASIMTTDFRDPWAMVRQEKYELDLE